jgi:mannan endo-1,4-beta-mannosidase
MCLMSTVLAIHSAFSAPQQQEPVSCEAEDGVPINTRIGSDYAGFSGGGYVLGFDEEGASLVMKVEVPRDGNYTLSLRALVVPGPSARVVASVYVDSKIKAAVTLPVTGRFGETAVDRSILYKAGTRYVAVSGNGSDFALDRITLTPAAAGSEGASPASLILSNPNASRGARSLMAYLVSIRGKAILAGQQASGRNPKELTLIEAETGKLPAVRGFDFIDYSPSRVERGARGADVDEAIAWWNRGGIVTFCWHWNAPSDLIDTVENPWYSGFYTRATRFDLEAALADPASRAYSLILRDIDAIAVQLKRLEAAGVPVLWRPLHEASGGWFWWGARGAGPYLKLWSLLFERLTRYHGLTNLIWVWNGQNPAWYPGDSTVDIIGEDVYAMGRDYGTQAESYARALACGGGKKLVTLSENGVIPDPDLLIRDGIEWSWFCVWAGTFVVGPGGGLSEQYTARAMLRKVYSSPYVITLDRLPDLKSY